MKFTVPIVTMLYNRNLDLIHLILFFQILLISHNPWLSLSILFVTVLTDYHEVYVFIWLISLSVPPSGLIHVVANWQEFLLFLRLHDTLIVHLYHIFFIHSSTNGHVSSFHTLATVTNVAMKMRVQLSLKENIFVSFAYTPRSRIAGSFIVLFLSSWWNYILFTIGVLPFSIPTNSI